MTSIEENLRFAFTWSDGALNNDWTSFLGPIRFSGDDDALRDVVRRYVKLRRRAEDWTPKRFDTNSHRRIARADVLALLAEAQRLDRGEANATNKRRPGRPRKSEGKRAECGVCGGTFIAKRSTARYCGDTCRQRAHYASRRAENLTLSTLKTLPFLVSMDPSATHAKSDPLGAQIGL